jgi:hypothetical protein
MEEYELISIAFQKLIAPHNDAELAKRVYARKWLPDKSFNLPDKSD